MKTYVEPEFEDDVVSVMVTIHISGFFEKKAISIEASKYLTPAYK